MESNNNIHLTGEKETLFITLYAKAMDNRSKRSILHDQAADDLVQKVRNNLSKYRGFGNSVVVVRARQFDEWINEFITRYENAVVVYLGCGLDTRIVRINPPSSVDWFDIDYPEVIELRKTFYTEREGYRMIGSSILETSWLNKIPNVRPTLIIAEGVFEYLGQDEVKTLLTRITGHFTRGQVLFDVMNSFAIKSGRQKLHDTTGAVHKWEVNDITEVDKLNPRLKRITELSVLKSPYTKKLGFRLRLFLRSFSVFPQFRNMLRLLKYNF
ncbi:MAG TPA: class I SAM-dependent methyltransferase [Chitinophagaceae bacterium]|jgi:O-methyltransferase involved in polyketide biosynthesis